MRLADHAVAPWSPYVFGKLIDEIGLDDLKALVEARTPEGRRLELKDDHYGRNDNAKREFAADISAMANSQGGYLLIGIDEENGLASRLVGVEHPNPDELVLGVSQAIRASIEPQILGFRVRWIATEGTRGVLIIQVDRSWNGPHRVTVAHDSRFFLRGENGKHPMSVDELRRAFLFASELEERIRRFRTERLQRLIADEGPLEVDASQVRLILHLVLRAAFTDVVQLQFGPHEIGIPPIGARGGFNPMRSMDGFVTYSGPEERFDSVRAFSTLFRNGTVEAVAKVHSWEKDGRRFIALRHVEQYAIDTVTDVLEQLRRRSVPPPHYLMLSFVGVRGLCAPLREWDSGLAYPHRSDNVLLPEFTIDEGRSTEETSSFLRPLLDLLWNAFGQPGTPSFDSGGRYRRE